MTIVNEWAKLSPAEWAQHKYGWLMPDGQPVKLTAWQRAVLGEYWARRDLVSTLFVSTVKKAGKTLLTSALLAYRWLTMPGLHFSVGNDRVQGEELQINVIADMARRHPVLKNKVTIQRSELTFEPTGSRIVSLPMNYSTSSGQNFLTVSLTEIWSYRFEDTVRLLEELTPIPLVGCLRTVDSYSGYEGEGQALKDMWDRGLAGERVNQDWPIFLNGQQLSYVHQGEDAQVRCWRGTEAQRVAYYAEQAATLRPETFRRLHLNQWAGREGEFLPVEVWDKLYEPGLELRPGDKKSSLVIGIDASVSGDATALCVVSRHPERHDDIAVRAMHVWLPPAGGQIDYSTTLLPTLLHYCENHNTVQVTFDPFQMHHFFNQFRERGLVWCKAFDQGQARIMADSALYQRLLAGGLRHDGNPIARRHFQNCASKSTDDSRLRIIKRGRGPIDAIVALSMASWECSRLLL